MTSGCTRDSTSTVCSEEACSTSSGAGGFTLSNEHLMSRSIIRRVRSCESVCIKMVAPDLPARPVRPDRCTNVSGSLGIS